MFIKFYSTQVKVLFVSMLLSSVGASMVMIFFPVLLLRMGVPIEIIGLAMTISVSTMGLSQLVGGVLSDRFGRKKALTLSFAVNSAVLALMGLIFRPLALIFLNIVVGLFFGFSVPASNAVVADTVGESDRVEAYGLLRIATNVGFGVGTLVGGFIAMTSYRLMLFFDAIGVFLSFFLIILFLKESMPQVPREKTRFRMIEGYLKIGKHKLFLAFCIVSLLLWLVFSQSMTPFAIYSVEKIGIKENELGILWSINCWLVVALQTSMARYIKKFDLMHVLKWGVLLCSISFLVVQFSNSFWLLLVFMALFTLSELIIAPSSSSIVASFAPEEKRGRYMGFYGFFRSVGWSIGPFFGGVMIGAFPEIHWFGIFSIGLFLVVIYHKLAVRRK